MIIIYIYIYINKFLYVFDRVATTGFMLSLHDNHLAEKEWFGGNFIFFIMQ